LNLKPPLNAAISDGIAAGMTFEPLFQGPLPGNSVPLKRAA
jgi:hypothetical protein